MSESEIGGVTEFTCREASEQDDYENLPPTKQKKSARNMEEDDEEDGEESNEEIDEELVRDLIDDNSIEDDDDAPRRRRKRRKSDELLDLLEDDDYDLLEENLGIKVQRKKYRRLRKIVEDDSSDDDSAAKGRDAIANQLFEGSDNEDGSQPLSRANARPQYRIDEDDSDESEADDFIVDDAGRPINQARRQRPMYTNAALQEAQDIFGIDFDYETFVKDKNKEHDEVDAEGVVSGDEIHGRQGRKVSMLQELFEPYDLENACLSESAKKIRDKDIPERLQLRDVPVTRAEEDELEEEALWIYNTAFSTRLAITITKADKPQVENWECWDDDPQRADTNDAMPPPPALSVVSKTNNWGDNWDAQTTVPAPAESAIGVPPPPSSSVLARANDWGDNWDAQTTVPAPAESAIGVPPPPSSSVFARANDWGDNWDAQTTLPAPPQSAVSILPPASCTVTGGNQMNPVNVGLETETCSHLNKSREPTEEDKQIILPKIRKTVEFIRNQSFEVPFIAFYRKDIIRPDLSISDLWNIYRLDARFCQLSSRKQRLVRLFENMKEYLDRPLSAEDMSSTRKEAVRPITLDDLTLVKKINSTEEHHDVSAFFSLHYGDQIEGMKIFIAQQRKSQDPDAAVEANDDFAVIADHVLATDENGEQVAEINKDGGTAPDDDCSKTDKKAMRRVGPGGTYRICQKLGVASFLPCYGITADALANNLQENYLCHEVNQVEISPADAAAEICSDRGKAPEEVIRYAKFMMATQIARHPLVRRVVRKVVFERATVSCWPTKKGQTEIDEGHPCYSLKYLKSKPLKSFKPQQFLRLVMAEKDQLLTITIGEVIPSSKGNSNYLEDVKHLFQRDEFSKNVQDWNALRAECLEMAFETILYPDFRKELMEKLLRDEKDIIIKSCSEKLRHWLKVAPYKAPQNALGSESEWNGESTGVRVIAIAYSLCLDDISYAISLTANGDVNDFLKLPNLMKNKNSANDDDKAKKIKDLKAIKVLMMKRKPQVVVVSGESREAVHLRYELVQLVNELTAEENFPGIAVEIVDNQLSKVYAVSNIAAVDFPNHPCLFKEAVSVGRRIQDPLLEFSQLCNSDDEITCVKFHRLQDQISKDELLEHLQIELINRTNEVGVDINRALAYGHTARALQFVCGLGPRKACAILKALKQRNLPVENKYQLASDGLVGSKVFFNCAGFLKIDVKTASQNAETYVELLDGTRIHPEKYEDARQIAMDVCQGQGVRDYVAAFEEILQFPELLDNFNVDKCLEEHGLVDHRLTVETILAELGKPYEDYRESYTRPKSTDLFKMLTRETPLTLSEGKLVTATVQGIHYVKPELALYDGAKPVKNEKTGMWQCVFCLKSDFLEIQEVWNHFDTQECPGEPIGIRIQLDNGISGIIKTEDLSDNQVGHPDEKVVKGQVIYCRIKAVNADKFSVDCTCKTSDLLDTRNTWKPKKDEYYDEEKAEFDRAQEKENADDSKKPKQEQQHIILQNILAHPSFKNVNHVDAEKFLTPMSQGDLLVRPSSKGANHLAITWKITDGIYQHIDVRTGRKKNASATKHPLYIGSIGAEEEFEDIDEIIARYVNPMASHIRDISDNQYYVSSLTGDRKKAETYLMDMQKANPKKIHYVFHPCKELPGKFILSYRPSFHRNVHEYFTVTPEGIRFRQQMFDNLLSMLAWFKAHYKDPPPQYNNIPCLTPNAAQAYQKKIVSRQSRACPPPPTRSIMAAAVPKGQAGTTPLYTTPASNLTPYSTVTPKNIPGPSDHPNEDSQPSNK